MRYIRFLKAPKVDITKGSSQRYVHCLITITSDLGDSFLPYHVELSAELLACELHEEVVVWTSVYWLPGMRSLPIKLPLPRSCAQSPLRVRVGSQCKSIYDKYGTLLTNESRGIVSAWSTDFTASLGARKFVERRFEMPEGQRLSLWEETGESIARHLWDAGVALACNLKAILGDILSLSAHTAQIRVLELGTGCGIVGIAIAQTIPGANVLLTDLPEARDIVERNMGQVTMAQDSSLRFQELDWDGLLPSNLQSSYLPLDLVVAADCTYNPDSSPALIRTIRRLAEASPGLVVAIAMKIRHSSEQVFFDRMAASGFVESEKNTHLLPGDDTLGEETMYLHFFKLNLQLSTTLD